MSEKLHGFLVDTGNYSKTYEDFSTQFATPESQARLYKYMTGNNTYTKSQEEFSTQFFNKPVEATTNIPTVPAEYKSEEEQKVLEDNKMATNKYAGWDVLKEVDGFPTSIWTKDGKQVKDDEVPTELMDAYKKKLKEKGKYGEGDNLISFLFGRDMNILNIQEQLDFFSVSDEIKERIYKSNLVDIEGYKKLGKILEIENAAAEIEKNRRRISLDKEKKEIKDLQVPFGYGSQMVDPMAGEGGGNIIGDFQKKKSKFYCS